MREKPSNFQDILAIPLRLDDKEAKEEHIINFIIPAMDKRRKRLSHLSEENVARKLWSPPASDKPGEEAELAQAITKSAGELLTIGEALEIADVVYYYLQPNAPEKASRENLEVYLFIILGEMSLALDFTIVKYEARLRFEDMTNYKKIEEETMQKFFEIRGLPESLIYSN